MRNEQLCTHLIEKIVGIKVRSLHYQAFRKDRQPPAGWQKASVLMYVEDEEGRVYDIEMQCTNSPEMTWPNAAVSTRV